MKPVLSRQQFCALLLGSQLLLPLISLGWPVSLESNIFNLTSPPMPVCTTIASASGESNLFDLNVAVNAYFSAESNIFSLQGRESDYTFNLSAIYTAAQGTVRITAYVYDRASGTIVSTGTGAYRITQGGQTLKSGSLSYVTGSRLWDSGSVALTAAGTLDISVTVNGRTATKTLVIPSGAPVHLIGSAKTDDGAGIGSGTVYLYNAASVFASADLNNLSSAIASASLSADSGASYCVNFEGADEIKSSYVSSNLYLSGLQWNLNNSVVQGLALDHRNGIRAARIRSTGTMTMLEDLTSGISEVSLLHAAYGANGPSSARIEYSTNQGATWNPALPLFTAFGSNLVSHTVAVNQPGSARIRIVKTSDGLTNQINIDDICIAPFSTAGNFDFGNYPPGQYVLVLITENGTTVGPAFWLRSGEGTHSETIIENPGRTDLLNRSMSFKAAINNHILDDHTAKMYAVAYTVDKDLDTSISKSDWFKLLFNITAGTVYNYGTAYTIGLSSSHFGNIAKEVAKETSTEWKRLGSFGLKAEEQYSVENQSHLAVGAASQPFFAYGRQNLMGELAELAPFLDADTRKLYDPNWSPMDLLLGGEFDRDTNPHRHDLAWFRSQGVGSLSVYGWAQEQMATYYSQFVSDLPALPTNFDTVRAQRILQTAEKQLEAISQGSALIYVSPQSAEVTVDGAEMEPLALNLCDFYSKYQSGQRMNSIAERVKEGSSWVSMAGWGTAGGCAIAGSFTGGASLPFAAGAVTVAKAASWVNFGASVIQAPIVADMGATYAQMSVKHNADLAVAPLALKRTQDFLTQEASQPYYLDSQKQFGGDVLSVDLNGGVNIGGKTVYFPIKLQLLPSVPPIEMTGEKTATVSFRNPSGKNSSEFRIETKISDFSGSVHNHVVIPGGEVSAGQSKGVTVPFLGYLSPNKLFVASTLETRLWTGPFQGAVAKTKQFYVVPININLSLSPLSAQDENVKMAMAAPLEFVKSESEPLSGDDLLAMADRIREQVETNLVVGASSFTREYSFPTNIFSAEFRLYRPVGASVAFRIEKDGEYIGWEESEGIMHQGFPGDYSGNEANPETITVPNIGGQTVSVQVAIGSVETEDVNVLLEVWEQPVRSAVMAVLPDAINSISRTGITHNVEIAIGESSHQQPLESVSFSASSLQSATGSSLNWTNISWAGTTNISAAGLKTCSMELNTRDVADGTYTGTVTVSSVNAGTISVPVSITIDGQAPQVNIRPMREWWFNPSGPDVTWTGYDNTTAPSNLLYTYVLEPLDGSWSGYSQTTNSDLSGVVDGDYMLSVVARDQALNETETPADAIIRIDRTGNLWKQRIVDADPDDDITNVAQVVWDDDFDGDGASNLMEYRAGTDPVNPGDLFVCNGANSSPTGFIVRWKAKRGVSYQVRRTTNLVSGIWEDAPAGAGSDEKSALISPVDGDQIYRDETATGGAFFYKIETRE